MAGGEIAVKTGNDGEKMMREFLRLVGWLKISQNETFLCSFGKKHKLSGTKSDKTSHNVDGVFHYNNPLNHSDTDIVLCSSKHNLDAYSDKSKAYSHLKDLAFSLECVPRDINFVNGFEPPDSKKAVYKGLLFWVSSNRDENKISMIERISDGLIKDDEEEQEEKISKLRGVSFDSIYLVDNQKATFISSAIKTAEAQFPTSKIQFLYPHTGLNNTTADLNTYGEIMPIQYVNTSLLPIVIEENDKTSVLFFCDSNFDKDFLKRIIWLAHKIANLASQINIYFNDYDTTLHEADENQTIRLFNDSSLVDKITVKRTNLYEFTLLKEEQVKRSTSFLTSTRSSRKTLFTEYKEDDIDKILPFGEMIKPVVSSTILSETDLKSFLVRKGVYVGNKEKQSTVPLLSTLLLSPAELDTLKFLLKEKEDKVKSVPRKAELGENKPSVNDLAVMLQGILSSELKDITLPSSCTLKKTPAPYLLGDEVIIPFTLIKQNSTKDLLTGKVQNDGAIRFRAVGNKMDNQIDYTSRESFAFGNKVFDKLQKGLLEQDVISKEFKAISFDSFNNAERISFFLRFLNTQGVSFFSEAKLLYMVVKPDNSLEEELPFDLESLKDKVNELAISGKELESVHYFQDKYKKALLMQKVKIKYRFNYGALSGTCLVELDFKNALSKSDENAQLEFHLEISKRGNRGQNLTKPTQELSKEYQKLIQKVYKELKETTTA